MKISSLKFNRYLYLFLKEKKLICNRNYNSVKTSNLTWGGYRRLFRKMSRFRAIYQPLYYRSSTENEEKKKKIYQIPNK